MTDPPERAESAEQPGAGQPEEGSTAPGSGSADPPRESPGRRPQRQRKQMLLRLDPAMYDALARWASDELRSTNAQIDYLLRKALADARRLPGDARPHPRRGRPAREE